MCFCDPAVSNEGCGNYNGFTTAVGWDPVTGWGTPNYQVRPGAKGHSYGMLFCTSATHCLRDLFFPSIICMR